MTGFGARLAEAKASRGPLCLGIDPHPELLRAWDLPATADGLAAFCDACVEAFAGFAVVNHSGVLRGIRVRRIRGTGTHYRGAAVRRGAGAGRCKRGDIGTTMAAYAAAWRAIHRWPPTP